MKLEKKVVKLVPGFTQKEKKEKTLNTNFGHSQKAPLLSFLKCGLLKCHSESCISFFPSGGNENHLFEWLVCAEL